MPNIYTAAVKHRKTQNVLCRAASTSPVQALWEVGEYLDDCAANGTLNTVELRVWESQSMFYLICED
jgi:hypothetical protein